MAPDLNSVPPSPRDAFRSLQSSASSSRRASQLANPPTAPAALAREFTHMQPSPSGQAHNIMADNTGVGGGPGPLRHPRPLTAADLHLELEKEQEAVVNRLTRELSLLRQQSVSVASTTSSTSAGVGEPTDNHTLLGSLHPTPSRRHRSSSSLSSRSINAAGITSSTVSRIAPAREATLHSSGHSRDGVSRRSSVTSSRRSELPSPSLPSSQTQGDHFHSAQLHRHPSTSQHGYLHNSHVTTQAISPSDARSPTRVSTVGTARFEEAAFHRSELESAKHENEMLRRRIRELERTLSGQRQQGMSRNSSEMSPGRSAEHGTAEALSVGSM
ncbi:hypothetical protein MMC26_004952 [Xylographa opegraphella]|nr:hypothetical protein [Xylographa opegraphella]